MYPEIFGWQHLTFLAISCVLIVIALILIKKFCKSEKVISIAVKVTSALLLVAILANRILLAVKYNSFISFIPNTFCGLTSLCFAIVGLCAKKDSGLFHWIVYCGILGGFLTMLYPDFIGQATSIFYPLTITGLLHHTLAFFLGLLIIVTGYMRISLRRWAWLPLGLSLMMCYGLFLITALGLGDAMYIYEPLISDTIFTWYFTGFLFLLLHLILLVTVELVRRKKSGLPLLPKKEK